MAGFLDVVLKYVIVPLWLVAGVADYLCHRAARIEQTSGLKESLLHFAQFAQVGIGLLAALFLEINALVVAVMLLCAVIHEATAVWDVRYANATRTVAPREQHIHGVLEMLPFTALLLVAARHWETLAEPRFSVQWKQPPLPAWYLGAVLGGVLILGVIPYGEEFLRTARARWIARAAASRRGQSVSSG